MIVWLLSLPALVVLLTAFAVLDQVLLWAGRAGVLPWRRGRDNRPVAATGFEVLHGSLSYGKAEELKQRRTTLLLRDDGEAGAPPNGGVDLDAGVVLIPRAATAPRPPGLIPEAEASAAASTARDGAAGRASTADNGRQADM